MTHWDHNNGHNDLTYDTNDDRKEKASQKLNKYI